MKIVFYAILLTIVSAQSLQAMQALQTKQEAVNEKLGAMELQQREQKRESEKQAAATQIDTFIQQNFPQLDIQIQKTTSVDSQKNLFKDIARAVNDKLEELIVSDATNIYAMDSAIEEKMLDLAQKIFRQNEDAALANGTPLDKWLKLKNEMLTAKGTSFMKETSTAMARLSEINKNKPLSKEDAQAVHTILNDVDAIAQRIWSTDYTKKELYKAWKLKTKDVKIKAEKATENMPAPK